jgi:hypothetical protein
MSEGSAKFFREQIARIRRLLSGVTDEPTERALRQLAEEYQARAAEAEREEKRPASPERG